MLTVLESQKSDTKVPADLVSAESFSPASEMLPSFWDLIGNERERYEHAPNGFFYKNTNPIDKS